MAGKITLWLTVFFCFKLLGLDIHLLAGLRVSLVELPE